MAQVKQSLESIYLKLGINSMKFTFVCFLLFMAVKTGNYIGQFALDYFDSEVEKAAVAKIEEMQKLKGKPAFCSFYQ